MMNETEPAWINGPEVSEQDHEDYLFHEHITAKWRDEIKQLRLECGDPEAISNLRSKFLRLAIMMNAGMTAQQSVALIEKEDEQDEQRYWQTIGI